MPRNSSTSFRVGKVQGYCRGSVWYLCYHEHGKRRRPRVGPDRAAAEQLAAQINGQLAVGAPAALSFEPIAVPALRESWLRHHEQVLRSSVQTIDRYRTATDHLLRFLEGHPVRHAAMLHTSHAAEFVRHLRSIRVSPNGHAHTAKRPLMDKGVRYVLECCRALFNFAAKRRHLSPYADNPFSLLEIDRIPVEVSRPIDLFTADQERSFVAACDAWQFPLFLTLMLTGLRPGELCHLLVPDDIDLNGGWLRVRNKPRLGWKVKTRNERDIPLLPVLVIALQRHIGARQTGPLFLHRRSIAIEGAFPNGWRQYEKDFVRRLEQEQLSKGEPLTEKDKSRIAKRWWVAQGAVDEDRVRTEFMRLTAAIGAPGCTAPKVFRHMFATALQEGRVDPLVRNELMGHVAAGSKTAGHGLVAPPA